MATSPRLIRFAFTIRAQFSPPRFLVALTATVFLVALLAAPTAAQEPYLANNLEIEAHGMALRYPDGWSVFPKRFSNMDELVNVPADQQETVPVTARVKITSEPRIDHAEALGRLRQIGAGHQAPATAFLLIGGWPALQHRCIEQRPQPSEGPQFADKMVMRITTAIAVESLIVRLDGSLPSDADPALVAQVEAMGRSAGFSASLDPAQAQAELEALRSLPRPPQEGDPLPAAGQAAAAGAEPASAPTAGALSTDALSTDLLPADFPEAGLTRRVIVGRNGELEIAVSPNGRNIVIGQQSFFRTSNDGGQTFPFSGFVPFGGGDPSLAFGVSGRFYYAGIRGGCQAADVAGPFGYTCTGIAVSANNGQTFPNVFNAVVCPNGNPNNPPLPGDPPNPANRCFPDQEHIAADRVNAAPGGDQVYSTWRNFDATDQDPGLVCSQNSGQTWTAPFNVGAGAFPRIGVGQDGFVYVVWLDGVNYQVRKFSSCATGLVPQAGFPQAVTAFTPVVCPFVGHDRCDQNPSSQTIAVDDTNPNHVYFAYAENTAAGNEDIFVQDSLNGGMTWPAARTVRVNAALPGKRIMPWVCTTGGEAFVTWYDRRAAPPNLNDLTDYFGGKAFLNAGVLTAGPDFRITEVGDPWCASGWQCGTRAVNSAEQCSVQPQLAGICCDNTQPNCPGSQQPCDFSDGGCPVGETCNTGNGCPKYGDYNGNACAAGRLYSGWASATSPPGIAPPSNSIDIFFNVQIVGEVPQIQVPGNVTLPDTCVGSTSTETLDVCNTGTANLEVNSIASSNSQFAVTTPTSGYPVIISPDFCFPFQVRFTPTSIGLKSTTLTIASNDPSLPSVTVSATGNAGQPQIDTLIADGGDFGDVCVGDFKDLDLTIHNSGRCELSVTAISSSSLEFQTAGVMSFPVVVAPGVSLQVPIRFQPTSLGAHAGNITVSSNDPVTPSKIVAVNGSAPSPDIRLTGSANFGDVCAGAAEKAIQVCNVGACNLNVTGASFVPPCSDFTLINNPFPAAVSPDSCLNLVIRFTPTSAGTKTCTLVINSDDPDTPSPSLVVTANTPSAAIDVEPVPGFPPTVIGSVGACVSTEPFLVSNTGMCNLTINQIAITSNPEEFSLSGLPSSPIILEPGHLAGDGALGAVFAPDVLGRARAGNVRVTYVSDPVTGATMSVDRALCGEGVRTGARVLVRAGGSPLSSVERIHLQRVGGNRNKDHLDTVDNAKDLALQTVVPTAPCSAFQYHREYGTVSNPIQLLPGSYVVTATAIVNGKRQHKTVGFDVSTCDFNPTVIVDF